MYFHSYICVLAILKNFNLVVVGFGFIAYQLLYVIQRQIFFIHTDTHIYIYIYSQPQTDCFVLSEFFCVARHGGRSKPGGVNPSNGTLDLVSDRSPNKRITFAKGIFKVLSINSSSSARLFTFLYPIGYVYIQGSLNTFPGFFCMGNFIDSTHTKLKSPSK